MYNYIKSFWKKQKEEVPIVEEPIIDTVILPFPNQFPHQIIKKICEYLLPIPAHNSNDKSFQFLIDFIKCYSLVSKEWNSKIISQIYYPSYLIDKEIYFIFVMNLLNRGIYISNIRYAYHLVIQIKPQQIILNPMLLEYSEYFKQTKLKIIKSYSNNNNNNDNNEYMMYFWEIDSTICLRDYEFDFHNVIPKFNNVTRISLTYNKQFSDITCEDMAKCLINHHVLEELDVLNITKVQGNLNFLKLCNSLVQSHGSLKILKIQVENIFISKYLDEENDILVSLKTNSTIKTFISSIIYNYQDLIELLNQNKTLSYLDLYEGFAISSGTEKCDVFINNESLTYYSNTINSFSNEYWSNPKLQYLNILYSPKAFIPNLLSSQNISNLVEFEVNTHFQYDIFTGIVLPLLRLKSRVFKYLKINKPHSIIKVSLPYDEFIKAILEHPSIEGLYIQGYTISDSALKQLISANHPTLSSLQIVKSIVLYRLSDIAASLSNNNTITTLNLDYSYKVSDLYTFISKVLARNKIRNLSLLTFIISEPSKLDVSTAIYPYLNTNTQLRSFRVPNARLIKVEKLRSKFIQTTFLPLPIFKIDQSDEKSPNKIHLIFNEYERLGLSVRDML